MFMTWIKLYLLIVFWSWSLSSSCPSKVPERARFYYIPVAEYIAERRLMPKYDNYHERIRKGKMERLNYKGKIK